MGQREQSKDDAGGENVGSHGRESWVGDRGRERRRQAPAFGPDVRLASKPGASNTHAAYPSTRSPPLSGEGVGFQPAPSLASSSSFAPGRWSQTATAVTAPSQVTSYARYWELSTGTSTSCVNSSCVMI